MPPPSKLKYPTDVTMIKSMLYDGWSYRKIAGWYSCDHETVRKFVKKHIRPVCPTCGSATH